MSHHAFTSISARSLAIAAALLILLLAIFSGPSAQAVEPGVNCASYDGETCVIEIGDIWFCDSIYTKGECPTSIRAGDTIRWEYPASGMFFHTATECGADCDAPTESPLWDSDRLLPGDSFEYAFDAPGTYLYYCTIHPTQRGMIRVLAGEPKPTPTPAGSVGDVNCDASVDSIDAALVLQLVAGLVDALPCEENADANADGANNAIDAALILQFNAGLIETLPA